jgi:hypothetical protein
MLLAFSQPNVNNTPKFQIIGGKLYATNKNI